MQQRDLYQAKLLDRYLQGTATPKERAELFEWLRKNSPESISRLEEIIAKNYREAFSEAPGLRDTDSERVLAKILDKIDKHTTAERNIKAIWWRVASAASILLIAGVALYLLSPVKTQPPVHTAKAKVPFNIQAPQSNHAIITLANGEKVVLDSAGKGQIALQGNMRLVKMANGRIAYENADHPANKSGLHAENLKPAYNTLTNPRSSQAINITLSDGSRVWLNAGSSITFPVAFVTNKRNVSITGEAYFEVAHDAAKPFYVTKGNMEVKVLGTRFNVDAYDDEPNIKVTLVEGSIRMSVVDGQSLILKPGQQATIHNFRLTTSDNVDIEQITAWKKGLFDFDGMSLKEAAPQLEHWYDIKVEYEAGMPDVPLFGKIDRTLSLADLLDILRGAGFRFRLEEDRKLVLMK